TPLRLKKLYVLGALLIENYHEQNKAKAAAMRSKTDSKRIDAQAALSGLLAEDDSVSVIDSKMIDGAWRGAEACHFYMLAQQQLYQGNVDAAMKTTLHLTDYDDILDPLEIFSLLALASCAARQFSVCSRAFIKLESVEGMAQAERDAFQKLALDIFTKNSPKDNRTGKAECTGCETLIPDYCQVCPSCDTKFPTCIVTGRPLMDYQFWLCPVCKHRAYEQEIQSHKFCPLCHVPI
uniref:WD repeat-containing protein 35 n=1 Tax=Plectus sambesii TaxID=2011161 RepID=A0A914X385_9BILA